MSNSLRSFCILSMLISGTSALADEPESETPELTVDDLVDTSEAAETPAAAEEAPVTIDVTAAFALPSDFDVGALTAPPHFAGPDLKLLGRALVLHDHDELVGIRDKDLMRFGRSVILRDLRGLNNVHNQELVWVGHAVIGHDHEKLHNLEDEDFVWLAWAMIEHDLEPIRKVEDPDFVWLAQAIVGNNLASLDNIRD
ncbi:MAG: hypothetical protein QGG40_02930 [Myxococcota bacterium]|nr:hypothetical protein [Myxococcota bacterium]